MKNKYTFTTYFKEQWWPEIKKAIIMILSISLILAIVIPAFAILYYFSKNNITTFDSIIALIVILIIIYLIHDDYQDCKKINNIHKRSNNYEK